MISNHISFMYKGRRARMVCVPLSYFRKLSERGLSEIQGCNNLLVTVYCTSNAFPAKKILMLANILINKLVISRTSFCSQSWAFNYICNCSCSFFKAMYLLPFKTEMDFQEWPSWRNHIPEIFTGNHLR